MRVIADNGRFALVDADGRLLFIERRGLIPAWSIFVVGLLTTIFAINGCLLVGLGVRAGDGRLVVGLGMIAAAAAGGSGCVALVRRRRARRQRGIDPGEAIVVLDLAAATRVWRDFFPSPDQVYLEGIEVIKKAWNA